MKPSDDKDDVIRSGYYFEMKYGPWQACGRAPVGFLKDRSFYNGSATPEQCAKLQKIEAEEQGRACKKCLKIAKQGGGDSRDIK